MEPGKRVKVLDHGYVKLLTHCGSDEFIVESARMSTAKGFVGWGPKCRSCGDSFDTPERDCPNPVGQNPLVDCGRGGHYFDSPGDEKLLKYMWDHKHSSPFEFGEIVVEVKAPIFVFREWHRHRTQSYSEMSSRYVPLPDENYRPDDKNVLERANAKTSNRQASGSGRDVSTDDVDDYLTELDDVYAHIQRFYVKHIERGIPKELVRVALPVGRYSAMRAKANLWNWLRFLNLRCATAAQWEFRQYAFEVAGFVKELFPRTYDIARESLGLP